MTPGPDGPPFLPGPAAVLLNVSSLCIVSLMTSRLGWKFQSGQAEMKNECWIPLFNLRKSHHIVKKSAMASWGLATFWLHASFHLSVPLMIGAMAYIYIYIYIRSLSLRHKLWRQDVPAQHGVQLLALNLTSLLAEACHYFVVTRSFLLDGTSKQTIIVS